MTADRKDPPAKRRRKQHPLDGLRDAIADHVANVLRRQYGAEGKNTIQAVAAAIRAAGADEDKPAPLIEACATAASAKLIERRGERDLGLATRLNSEARQAASRWTTER